jgi:hypothetical protein
MENRSMPICFTTEDYKKIKKFAQKHGMVSASQAIEKIADEL